ncbi:sulfatase-like hydrolase/transferase [Maribellus comscasis]|uniref:Sulfatase-like hydrolase/transferase n=1 Tax=Maribellus comscasis TaxID=2681766 RepID=A0A6I6JWX0_9BACT|nr:sulfatase [Maribellus comscasis]QGY45630.1 sulfatase-like hydrolase/transferase [Maribellus comscasis]
MKRYAIVFFALLLFFGCQSDNRNKITGNGLNVLFLTLDDMGYGTSGAEGCKVPDITPNIDALASQGILFTHGYVSVPMCGPSRAAMLSGRYPHCSGIMGHGVQPPDFWEEPLVKTPALSTYLHDFGYKTGAILKNGRCGNQTWDVKYQELPFGVGFHDRNPNSFYERTKAFIAASKETGKPFFLYANPIDPHRPWVNTQGEKNARQQWNSLHEYPAPNRSYTSNEVEIPECLPDLPDVRTNLVPYYEALHRGDECLGSILKALEESGEADNTIIVFLSDNGMATPAAKNTLYQHGVRTPVIIKLPGKIKTGVVDEKSVVCAIDLLPTILEALQLPAIKGIEGYSVYDVATGKKEKTDREYAFTSFDYWGDSKEKDFYPQRSIINKEFCYIWNPYVERFKGEKRIPLNWVDVIASSISENLKLAARTEFLRKRPVEEFYDLSNDPGCWNNLINDEQYADKIKEFKAYLKKEMMQTNDPERYYYNN